MLHVYMLRTASAKYLWAVSFWIVWGSLVPNRNPIPQLVREVNQHTTFTRFYNIYSMIILFKLF